MSCSYLEANICFVTFADLYVNDDKSGEYTTLKSKCHTQLIVIFTGCEKSADGAWMVGAVFSA